MAAGPASEVLKDDLLSAAYGCRVLTNRTPGDGKPVRAAAGHLLARSRARQFGEIGHAGDATSPALKYRATHSHLS